MWTFVVFVSVCCAGVLLPAGEVDIAGPSMIQHSSISLYQLGKSKESVRAFLHGYRDSTTRKVGAKVLGKVAPHLRGRARADVADVRDTMEVLDTIKDEDIETVGTITSATMWTLLALNAVAALLVYGVTAATSRLRLGAALVAALLAATIGVGIHLVLRRVVAEANTELGRDLFSLRVGAFVIPIAAVAAAGAMIALLVAHTRERRALAAAAAAPYAGAGGPAVHAGG